MQLFTLQFETTQNFDNNLKTLVQLIEETSLGCIVLAPELCLTGYAYDRMDIAAKFSLQAFNDLLLLSQNKTIITTLLTKNETNEYFNTLYVFHNGKVIHTQSKHKLFVLNDERKFFTAGNAQDIQIFEINGIKIACLICFELRFTELWEQIKGAHIICVPAMWGNLRKEHYEILTRALAVANQCYVIASDSANNDMAKSSGIIDPFGNELRDDNALKITMEYEANEVKKMRRYMNTGIKF